MHGERAPLDRLKCIASVPRSDRSRQPPDQACSTKRIHSIVFQQKIRSCYKDCNTALVFSQCFFTMLIHNVTSQWSFAMFLHNVTSQCSCTIFLHNIPSQYSFTMFLHKVSSQRFSTMLLQYDSSQYSSAIVLRNVPSSRFFTTLFHNPSPGGLCMEAAGLVERQRACSPRIRPQRSRSGRPAG